MSDAIAKLSSAQSLTKEELLAISDNKNAQAVLKEMTGQLTGGQNIDSVNSNSVNVQNKSQSRLSGSESYALGVADAEIQRYKDNGDSMYAKYLEGLRDNARIEDGKQIERAAIEKQFPKEKLQELARNGDYDKISFVNAKLKALDKMTDYSVDNSFYKNLSIENSKRNAASQNNSAVITAMPQYAMSRVGSDSTEGSIGSQLGNITTTNSSQPYGGNITTSSSETVSPATNSNNAGVDGKNSGEYNDGKKVNPTKIDYKKVFFNHNPELKGHVVVHHSIEQQVLTRPETKGLFTPEEIHAYDNLRGIPNEVNSDIHLSKIRKEWNKFYKENPSPTKDQLLNKRQEIDQKYGNQFNPPINK